MTEMYQHTGDGVKRTSELPTSSGGYTAEEQQFITNKRMEWLNELMEGIANDLQQTEDTLPTPAPDVLGGHG